MRRAASLMRELQIIPFPSIDEIGYCVLGRGGAVGAGRELPAHLRVPALTAWCLAFVATWRAALRLLMPHRS